jgi:hypothetical protein
MDLNSGMHSFSGRSIKKILGKMMTLAISGRIQAREKSSDHEMGLKKLQIRNNENNELWKTSSSKKYQRSPFLKAIRTRRMSKNN